MYTYFYFFLRPPRLAKGSCTSGSCTIQCIWKISIHTYVYICIHACAHVQAPAQYHAYGRLAFTYTCPHVCMYIYMYRLLPTDQQYTYIYIYIYIYLCVHISSHDGAKFTQQEYLLAET